MQLLPIIFVRDVDIPDDYSFAGVLNGYDQIELAISSVYTAPVAIGLFFVMFVSLE